MCIRCLELCQAHTPREPKLHFFFAREALGRGWCLGQDMHVMAPLRALNVRLGGRDTHLWQGHQWDLGQWVSQDMMFGE